MLTKKLGQYFLKNKSAVKKIIAALELRPNEIVIEIGAGHGELTRELISNFSARGGSSRGGQFSIFNKRDEEIKIIAIEKDGSLANALARDSKFSIFNFQKDRLDKLLGENFLIIEGDALKILAPLVKFLNLKIPNCKLKIIGNIPYYITGHLLRIIGELENKPTLCVLTIQKEVAERIAALPPKMNRLAASVQFWAKPEILGYIPKKDFRPAPKVDSAIVKLTTLIDADKKLIDADKYYRTVKTLFQQPRQTTLNNLSRAGKHKRSIGINQPDRHKSAIAEKLSAININPQDRPQNLGVEDIVKISNL